MRREETGEPLTYASVTVKSPQREGCGGGRGKVLIGMSKTVAHRDRCNVRTRTAPQRECAQPRSCQSAAAFYWTD